MTRSITIYALGLAAALTAAAADTSRMEAFVGYTYVRVNSATNAPSFDSNGGSGQFVYNFNPWLGAVADLGAVHTGHIGNAVVDNTIANFLFGPRLSKIRFKDIQAVCADVVGWRLRDGQQPGSGRYRARRRNPGQPVTARYWRPRLFSLSHARRRRGCED